MLKRKSLATGITAGIGMLIFILDSKTAVSGALKGIQLCIHTLIPSLFPLFVLSTLLTGALSGSAASFLAPIGKLCRIPKGSESTLLIGLLGGYPVGAQCIAQAYKSGQMSQDNARRMLGFCNNAGPAFLFGMVGSLFSSPLTVFVLWGVHIASALFVGMLLPGRRDESNTAIAKAAPVNLTQALERSLKTMALVCGWVVLFRAVLAFAQRWFLWLLPQRGQLLFSGLLELSNGCYGLNSLISEAERFFFSGIFLSFGGICVGMQTVSICADAGLDSGLYFPGKLLQGGIGMLLSLCVIPLLFPDQPKFTMEYLLIPVIYTLVLVLILKRRKNNSSIPTKASV